jgi:hypothetical protein
MRHPPEERRTFPALAGRDDNLPHPVALLSIRGNWPARQQPQSAEGRTGGFSNPRYQEPADLLRRTA